MNFLIVTITSILFPYIMSLSGINYATDLGIKGSFQDFNKYDISLLKVSDNDGMYISESNPLTYRGDSIKPDLFIDYSLGNQNSRFFMATTFGFEPFDIGSAYTVKRKASETVINTYEIHYSKDPYVGLKFGYSILKNNPKLNGYSAFGFTPYITAGLMPITYGSGDSYGSDGVRKYITYWGVGSKISVKGPWSFYVEYRNLKIPGTGTSLSNEVSVKEQTYQFGFSYRLTSAKETADLNAQKNYSAIIKEINKNNEFTADSKHQVYSSDTKTIKSNTNQNTEIRSVISNQSNSLTKESNLVKQTTSKKVEGLYNLDSTE